MSKVIESSISQSHDIEATEHGLGLDLCQNGLCIHIDHSQFGELSKMLSNSEQCREVA